MAGANLIVFRDYRKEVPAADLLRKLGNAIDRLPHSTDSDAGIDALLLAGQLECALEDCNWPCSQTAEAITNGLAARLLGTCAGECQMRRSLEQLASSLTPTSVRISPAEGFAYYALHPADFADAAMQYGRGKRVAVIGIRSIGTVLSAVAMAALNSRGIVADRITVRPQGHPYNRTLALNHRQAAWVQAQTQPDSHFLIVDEGPGLSGSSFLAAAEALVVCGVDPNRITLMGTRDVDPGQLCTPHAANRWSQFHWQKVASRLFRDFAHFIFVGGGIWRSRLFSSGLEWPPCWPEMERLKFLSCDRAQLFKFEGFGESGSQARERARSLSQAGFGPCCENAGSGMLAYEFVRGHPLNRNDGTPAMLERVADYCAFRAAEFKTTTAGSKLEAMMRFNFTQEFGRDLVLPDGSLESPHAAMIDGRMHPHEWIASSDGRVLKVDAATHGNDHFMPGPTDIAWDLAGTVVEWNLDAAAQEFLLSRFESQSGMKARDRFQYFLLAYAIFRMSYCRMAASGTQSPDERLRLREACEFYRGKIVTTCRDFTIQQC